MTRRHFGSTRELPSGRWQASYWQDGERHIAQVTFRTKSEAQQYLSTVESDLIRGLWIRPGAGRLTFDELAAQWLTSNPAKRADTFATDEYHIRAHFRPAIGSRRITDVTPAHLQRIVNDLSAQLAPRTVRRAFGVARAVFAHAVATDLLARTPCRGVKLPRVDIEPRRTPTPDELTALANAMPRPYRPMIYLGALLGLRFSEVAGLRLSRVDLVNGVLSVQETVTRDGQGRPVLGPPKSSASRRTIAMPVVLCDVLLVHVAESVSPRSGPGDPLLFTSPDGGPLRYANWRNRIWVPACRVAGVDGIGFHSLRRASATAMVTGGVDLKTAQTRLGHSDPRLTLAIYAQAVGEADREAAELVAERLLPRM